MTRSTTNHLKPNSSSRSESHQPALTRSAIGTMRIIPRARYVLGPHEQIVVDAHLAQAPGAEVGRRAFSGRAPQSRCGGITACSVTRICGETPRKRLFRPRRECRSVSGVHAVSDPLAMVGLWHLPADLWSFRMPDTSRASGERVLSKAR